MSHVTTIKDPEPGTQQHYWWSCSCGDEGGPHDSYNEAWDATVEHERNVPRVLTMTEPPEYIDGVRNTAPRGEGAMSKDATRLHLRLDAVTPAHITETLFMDGRLIGRLTMDHVEYQLFGAALRLGADRMRGHLVVESDPIAHDAEGHFAMPPSTEG